MGFMDLFRGSLRKSAVTETVISETRAIQPGYTASLMAAREAWISGGSGLAELTGARPIT